MEKTIVGTIYVLNFIPGTLGLPDDNYYKGTAPGKIKVLTAYINFIKKILSNGLENMVMNLRMMMIMIMMMMIVVEYH